MLCFFTRVGFTRALLCLSPYVGFSCRMTSLVPVVVGSDETSSYSKYCLRGVKHFLLIIHQPPVAGYKSIHRSSDEEVRHKNLNAFTSDVSENCE